MPSWLLSLSLGLPPLVFVTDTAEPGLRAWWREGELLVAPTAASGRPGMRPLVGASPVPVPADLAAWTPLGLTCSSHPKSQFTLDGRAALLTVSGAWDKPMLELTVEDRMVAAAPLGRPASVCGVHVGQADSLPGPEVMVSWRFGEGANQLYGLSVFRVPETAR